MKTLLNVDKSILKDYSSFEMVNDKWDIGAYLNTFYDLNAAIAFSKLFYPDFVETRGCVIISMRYDRENFESWYNECQGEISEIEKMCNLYEIKDLFHINPVEFNIEEGYSRAINILGDILKKSWDINLKLLYPDKRFNVDVFEEYDSTYITLYSIK